MWLQKTKKGRVVYDRKPHLFTWKDAARISKSLDHLSFFQIKEFWAAMQVLASAAAALRSAGPQTVLEGLQKVVSGGPGIDFNVRPGDVFQSMFDGLSGFIRNLFRVDELGVSTRATGSAAEVVESSEFNLDVLLLMVEDFREQLRVIVKE